VLAHLSASLPARLPAADCARPGWHQPPLSLSFGSYSAVPPPYAPEGGTLSWYEGGSAVRLHVFPRHSLPRELGGYGPELVPGMQPHEISGQFWHRLTRGAVAGFSAHSHRRLLQMMSEIDYGCLGFLPKFLTLTYPDDWPADPAVVAGHLHAMEKAFTRRFGRFAAPWRKEFQERGAAHFHLMLFLQAFVPLRWLRRTWHRITGADHAKNPTQGVNITRCKNVRQVRNYVSKYMAKVPGDGDVIGQSTGRLWGCWHKDLLPRHKTTVALTAPQRFAARRVLAKLVEKKTGRKVRLGERVHKGAPAICRPERVGVRTFIPAADIRRYAEFVLGPLPRTQRVPVGKPVEGRCKHGTQAVRPQQRAAAARPDRLRGMRGQSRGTATVDGIRRWYERRRLPPVPALLRTVPPDEHAGGSR
jgi:hypothetical protein